MPNHEQRKEDMATLAQILERQGVSDLAWNRRAWVCTEGHNLIIYRGLRTGRRCPQYQTGCAGRVTHPPLSWFSVEDALWEVAKRKNWTVVLTSYNGGVGYQWEIGKHKSLSESKIDAALDVLLKALL